MTTQENRWRGHVRRLLYAAGTATSVYLVASYALDRMREARLRAVKERKERDLLKNHFTSLKSTIGCTLYALLPTLQPQLSAEYPVEVISQALQGLSAPASSAAESIDPTPESSLVLQPPDPNAHAEVATPSSAGTESVEPSQAGVEQSWSSEFKTESVADSEQPSLVGDSMLRGQDDDAESSGLSQSISLPPTDTSSFSPSPPSDQSQFHSSPPQVPRESATPHLAVAGKSKKELWRDLKVQTITRTLTTAYLVPLLYLLTSSQLSTLARIRYLADVKSALPDSDDTSSGDQAHLDIQGLFGVSSSTAVGGSKTTTTSQASLLDPRRYIPQTLAQYLPFGSATAPRSVPEDPIAIRIREEQLEEERSEDERVYLSYSWWILHEGWRGVAERVAEVVEEVFGSMPLKRELSVAEWEQLIRHVRAKVETTTALDGTTRLYSFLPHLLPPSNSTLDLHSSDQNPLPTSYPADRPHLLSLLEQTADHLKSADATYLIEKGVTSMIKKLLEELREDSYSGSEIGLILAEPLAADDSTRRLVDCLPAIDRWGKSVWETMPHSGIENLTSIPEFEGFTALVFGDWAPRDS